MRGTGEPEVATSHWGESPLEETRKLFQREPVS